MVEKNKQSASSHSARCTAERGAGIQDACMDTVYKCVLRYTPSTRTDRS